MASDALAHAASVPRALRSMPKQLLAQTRSVRSSRSVSTRTIGLGTPTWSATAAAVAALYMQVGRPDGAGIRRSARTRTPHLNTCKIFYITITLAA
jgi:hypothetical protein